MLKETTFRIRFKEEVNGVPLRDLHSELIWMFEEVIQRGAEDYPGDAIARMYINVEGLNHPIIVRPRPLHEMTAEAVLEAIMAVLQSNESIAVTEAFTIQLGIAQFAKGGRRRRILNLEDDTRAKKSIVTIRNDDQLCFARALAVCLAKLDVLNAQNDAAKKKAVRVYNNIKKGDQARQNSQQKNGPAIPPDGRGTFR